MNRSTTYREVSISTSSPVKQVVMLYEGAIRFLRDSIDDIKRQDYVHKRQSIDRATAIIHYLQGTLDTEKGKEIARELNRLYTYMTMRIYEGSSKLESAPLQEVIKLLETLLSGWEEVALKDQKHAVSTNLMAHQASGERFEIQA